MSYEVVCLIDDDERTWGTVLNGVPVMGLEKAHEQFPEAEVAGGIGAPRLRQQTMEKATAMGFRLATLIHPRVERSRWIEMSEGTIICAGNTLTTNIKLGRGVQLNLHCTIGHDVIMGDYTTLAPGVHVSGWVHFGKRVYVGTGAVIINGTSEAPLTIGDDVVIGAGACVIRPVAAGLTVVGVPARAMGER
jgi:sugar O-acyltransferase (sialic acid O-acetyltransferase NeuD family)